MDFHVSNVWAGRFPGSMCLCGERVGVGRAASAMMFTVVKVGGSLFDLPDFFTRLNKWMDRRGLPILIVAGGGNRVDQIRRLDVEAELGEESSHWLALQIVAENANWLAKHLPRGEIVNEIGQAIETWKRGGQSVLDGLAFCRADESSPNALPHCWGATSDSLAARVASAWNATDVVLLKSSPPPVAVDDWTELGYVDEYFVQMMKASSIAFTAECLR